VAVEFKWQTQRNYSSTWTKDRSHKQNRPRPVIFNSLPIHINRAFLLSEGKNTKRFRISQFPAFFLKIRALRYSQINELLMPEAGSENITVSFSARENRGINAAIKKKVQMHPVCADVNRRHFLGAHPKTLKRSATVQAASLATLPLIPCFSWVYNGRVQRKTVLTVYPRVHPLRRINTEEWRLTASQRAKDESLPIGNLTEFDQIQGKKIIAKAPRLCSVLEPLRNLQVN